MNNRRHLRFGILIAAISIGVMVLLILAFVMPSSDRNDVAFDLTHIAVIENNMTIDSIPFSTLTAAAKSAQLTLTATLFTPTLTGTQPIIQPPIGTTKTPANDEVDSTGVAITSIGFDDVTAAPTRDRSTAVIEVTQLTSGALTRVSNDTSTIDDFDLTAQAVMPSATPILNNSALTATALAALFNETPTRTSGTVTITDGGQLPDTGGGGFPTVTAEVPFATSSADRELNFIGNGSAFLFHDDNVKRDENTLVELQVFFDEFYITATPTSAVTAIVASDLERPAVDVDATLTPRAARSSDDDIDLPEYLIAWLDCDDQFDNCGDGGILPMRIQSINSWRWSITPRDTVQGMQDLRVELWTVGGDGQRDQRIWTSDFQIGVEVGFLAENNNLVILTLVGLIIILMAVFGFVQWRNYREANRRRPMVFISYRRLVSAGFGRALHNGLTTAGADVFIDIDDIHAGSFSDYIKDNIRERQYFLVLLAPKTLESKWVVQEVLYAQEHNRTIIPVLLNDFDLYGDEMPDELTFLQQQNAVTLPVEHFESGVNRIKTFIGLK